MRAVAPGRSGKSWANSRPSSSHSCDRYLDVRAPPSSAVCGGIVASGLPGCPLAYPGEQVVLGHTAVDERPGEDVVVPGICPARRLGRQAEPERRLRVDLGGVGEQGLT